MTKGWMRMGLAAALVCAWLCACSATPKHEMERDEILTHARATHGWFERNVAGLRSQISNSAAYIVFPDVANWGIVFGGGSYGRGVMFRPDGRQEGWVLINNASVGLQAGVQGFRMLMVLENSAEVIDFKTGKWNGTANGVAVLADQGASAAAPFQDGLVVYQGANKGLMAGVNVGLNNIRFEPVTR